MPEHTLRSIDFCTPENQVFPNLTFIIINEKRLYSPSLLFLEASVCISRQYYTCAKNIIITDSVFHSTWIAIIKWFPQKKQYVPLSSRFFCIMNGHFYVTINNFFSFPIYIFCIQHKFLKIHFEVDSLQSFDWSIILTNPFGFPAKN